MSWYDTEKKVKLDTNTGIGDAISAVGNSAVKFADVEEDRIKKEKEKTRLAEQAKGMRDYLRKNGMDTSKMSDDNVRDNFYIHKASIDKNEGKRLEDAMINVYEQKHPIFMTKKIKNKDGTLIDNPEYKNLTREQKVAMVKYAGSHQIDPKSPDVVKITADENLNQVAWFKDGSYKKTNIKAYDYGKSRKASRKASSNQKKEKTFINDIDKAINKAKLKGDDEAVKRLKELKFEELSPKKKSSNNKAKLKIDDTMIGDIEVSPKENLPKKPIVPKIVIEQRKKRKDKMTGGFNLDSL